MIKLTIKERENGPHVPTNFTHVLTKMVSLNQSVLEKTLTNLWKGILQKSPFKMFVSGKTKKVSE